MILLGLFLNTIDESKISAINTQPIKAEEITLNQEEIKPLPVRVEDIIRNEFKDTPILIEISRCESQFRQFGEDGNVLRGVVNHKDVGAFQINEDYHLQESKKLGMDIYTLEGNMDYARHLYNTQGLAPWIYSELCWKK